VAGQPEPWAVYHQPVITGVHALIFTPQAEEVRAFFRDVLGFKSVDAGGGWLIFALPPAELGIHPAAGPAHSELYLMCDDIHKTVEELRGKGVEISKPITEQGFGLMTWIPIPGGELALYEPKHPTALPS
jgi:catechol 2,3-dioxygenase-like lactoylglutathione lyase family enzyme